MQSVSKKYLWIVLVILAIGVFVRTYHFESWIHFELDQARDAKVIDLAFEGSFWDLPLLGPKAGGTFLRLAPGFYYLQYLSGVLFGQSIAGISWLVAIFSILTLPALYFFLRRGFRDEISIGLTALASVCVFLVLFGRFGWNPNLLPFFLVLGFYALLRAVERDAKYKTRWFLLATFSLAFATHFHFLAFLAVPTIVGIFLLVKRARFSWAAWGGALLVVLFLYLPMLVNEVKTGGSNTSEFFGAITEKSTKEERTLLEKGIRNIGEFGQASVVIMTGYEGATFPSVTLNSDEFGIACDKKCDEGKWHGILGVLFLFFGIFFIIRHWWRAHNWEQADFYLLSLIWLGVALVLYLPLAFAVAPRFYLLTVPVFFVLLGAVLEYIAGFKKGKWLALVVLGTLIVSNGYFLFDRLGQLARAGTEMVENRPDRILKERVRVTLEQQEAIVEFFSQRYLERKVPVYMASEPQHQRALKYLLEERQIPTDGLKFSSIYTEGQYYLVLRSGENLENRLAKYRDAFEVGEVTFFGTLSVVEMLPKSTAIVGVRQDFSVPEKQAPSKAPRRYTWREVFGEKTDVELEEESSQDEEEIN
jgi:4-amino-4-deoxy-L-arabinose transferase-like glycosyltransferase